MKIINELKIKLKLITWHSNYGRKSMLILLFYHFFLFFCNTSIEDLQIKAIGFANSFKQIRLFTLINQDVPPLLGYRN
ncbi:MAG: hypothetical protein ACK42Z_06785 [Candidatus Kapaibacteriota bacterium]